MTIFDYRLLAALPFLLGSSTLAAAEEASDIWNSPITKAWMDDHVAVRSQEGPALSAFGRAQIWTSGIARSDMQGFAATPSDKSIGAKMQPFGDLDLRIGTEVTRHGETARFVPPRVNWETSWSRDWKGLGGLKVGLATTGSVGTLEANYTQSVSGSVGIPLHSSVDLWSTEFRLSPNMNLDTSTRAVGTSLTSEIVSRKVLSRRADAFNSVLNMKIGYDVAPAARPAASARLELRISPNL
jgi:hypothetical protein